MSGHLLHRPILELDFTFRRFPTCVVVERLEMAGTSRMYYFFKSTKETRSKREIRSRPEADMRSFVVVLAAVLLLGVVSATETKVCALFRSKSVFFS